MAFSRLQRPFADSCPILGRFGRDADDEGIAGRHALITGSPLSDSNETKILIQRARKGNEEATQRLLVMYHPRLRARLLRQMDATMKARIEPEDILQQVYLEAFRAIDQFEYQGKDSFLRWMYAILDRKLIDEHRAMRADRRDVRREVKQAPQTGGQTSYVDLMARIMSQSGTPSQAVRRDEAIDVLAECIAALPDHYRDVIQMRFIEGRPVSEVAKQLKRSIGSIHMICHRALRHLREEAERMGIHRDF